MYIRKILVILLILSLTITCTLSIAAVGTYDNQQMADRLNKLGIIEGDGKGNYNLMGTLKRTEAATFITSFLGKKEYIQVNKATLKKTVFSDVKETDWFAPYVGFCNSNGIIAGYNGKFGVKDNLTEQAFLVMILKVLNYNSPEDFNWNDNVFKLAYEIGLLSDKSYLNKVKDDGSSFTRGQAVAIMHSALGLKRKGEVKKLIQYLAENNAFSREAVISSGLLIDTVSTRIQEVTTGNSKRITVKLNEAVSSIDEKNIEIYEDENSNSKLSFSIISHGGNQLDLVTSSQVPGKSYSIKINMVEDLEGNIVESIQSSFKGYVVSAIQSDLFKISKAEQIGSNEVYLYFTQPINENIEYAPCYEIYEDSQLCAKGDEIKVSFTGDNYVASLLLKSKSFAQDKEYTIKISGDILGAYGTSLGEGLGDSITIVGKGMSESALVLSKISAVSNKAIKLDFNRKVNKTLAQQVYNYSVTDLDGKPMEVAKAVVLEDGVSGGKSVILTLKLAFEKSKSYNLMVNRINDVSKQFSIEEQVYKFSGDYPEQGVISVGSMELLDSGTVKVTFTKAVDLNAGIDTKNYKITDMSTGKIFSPARVKFAGSDQTSVRLYLKDTDYLSGNRPIKIQIPSTFRDYTGETLISSIDQGFFIKDAPFVKTQIMDAKLVGKDTIRISFTKEISEDAPNLSPQNYFLEYTEQGTTYKKVPIAITYHDDTSIVLRFDRIDEGLKYVLSYKLINDYAGNEVSSNNDKVVVVKGQ